jgi:dienelactone hydrolase
VRILKILAAILLSLCLATPSLARMMRPFRTVVEMVDSAPDRKIPVTIVVPNAISVRGLILFSHGANSNPGKYAALTERWAAAGYAVIAPLHADSEAWTGVKPTQAQSTAWRLNDMKAGFANLDAFGAAAGIDFAGKPIIVAGHSFGALIAELQDDPRVKAVIAYSPPGPFPGLPVPVVKKPMLTVTGTADILPMIAPKWDAHLAAHRIATGAAIAYVGKGANHYFGNIIGRTEYPGPPQGESFSEALEISHLFLRAYGDRDKAAVRKLKRYRAKQGTVERR